jgi:outer membrane receptor protein involved in Fe transport
MMTLNKYTVALLVAGCSHFGTSLAQDADFSELSLEDLLSIEVEVGVASTKAETIIETPAIVSRYDAADMEKMGLLTLKDILSFFPGFVLQDGKNSTMVMIRGVSESFNQKVLFLLDGIPYYMPSHGEIPLLGTPIEAIERVEVIRGPGAVIYGTNASGGVISVVTKKDSSKAVAARVNTNPFGNLSAYYGHEFSEDVSVSVSFEFQEDDGYEADYLNTPSGPAGRGFPAGPNSASADKVENVRSILLTARVHNWNFLLQTFDHETNGLIRFDTALSEGEIENNGDLIHVDYSIKAGPVDLNFFADRNEFHFLHFALNANTFGTVSTLDFSNGGDDNTRTRFGFRGNWIVNDNWSFLFGAEDEERSSGDFRIRNLPDDGFEFVNLAAIDVEEFSAYAQVDYTADKWRLLVGGRFTENDVSGNDITPRFSLVRTLNEYSSIKLLRSVGFNSPTLVQGGINLPGTAISDPDITAETITSNEIAYSYNKGNVLFIANAFYTELENLIERQPTGNGNESQFTNSDDIVERSGVELDSQFVIDRWKIYANVSYLREGNDASLADENDAFAFFSPKYTVYAGFSYQIDTKHSVGASLRHIDERNDYDAVSILNLSYNYRSAHHEIFATLNNSTGEDIVSADAGRLRATTVIPGANPDPNLTLGYRYKF